MNVTTVTYSGKFACFCILFLTACLPNDQIYSDYSKPAQFLNLEDDFLPKIVFPEESVEGTIIVRAALRISEEGIPGRIFIYTSSLARELFEPYEQAIYAAHVPYVEPPSRGLLPESRLDVDFSPAIFSGRSREVWFNLSFVFTKDSETTSTSIYPNLMYQADEYGMEYSDPQRVISSTFPRQCGGRGIRTGIWIAAEIDSNGNAANARVVAGEGSAACKRRLIETMLESDFIPAQHQGQFVNATYVEAWF